MQVYKSQPGIANGSRDVTGRAGSPLLWVITALLHGVVMGVSISILIARVAAQFPFGPSPSFGVYASAILVPILITFVYLLARAGTIVALFRLRQRRIGFVDAANIASVGYIAAAPLLVAVFLTALLPGRFTLLLCLVAMAFSAFLGEASLYVTTAKTGRFDRSITVPYAWLSAAWVLVVTAVVATVAGDVIGNWLDSYRYFGW